MKIKIPLPKFHPGDKVMFMYHGVIAFSSIVKAIYNDSDNTWTYKLNDIDLIFKDKHLILVNNCSEGLLIEFDFEPWAPC
jgi:hypothetical protein